MPQLVRVGVIYKYLTKRWTDGKMKIVAGRRNRSRDPMSDRQALYPLRHSYLCQSCRLKRELY